ncbi:MAG: carbon-nitrogen hydrolase family protein [Fimbriimonas ginsengisoli]|uniref:Carbon-nitrogen hydrolase family protein n=1 Tax=Fimbriimonas ginsengisoli TaxID=1005039 RepID=A0A931LTZ2_FIMGI|nr:carbon-nitrogen hydrolase family protein [Fimbriimonas ginsengisoli]
MQSDVVYGDPAANAARAVAEIERLAADGVNVVVFPEAFLTGYCAASAEDARAIAIPAEHPAIESLCQAADRFGMLIVAGFAERARDALFNSACILEGSKPPRFYRKAHLPELGLDKYVTPGSALPVFETAFGKIGVLICFDLRIPEATRVLALAGAEVLFLPTNWPQGAEVSAEHMCIARAAENRIFVATCDRVGEEGGFRFIGRSKIIAPSGAVLAAAGDGEETIVAEFDPAQARTKRSVIDPGRFETDTFATRQPELYRSLVEPLVKP